GRGGEALAVARGTYPVAEVGTAMQRIDLVESAATQEFAANRVAHGERELRAGPPGFVAMPRPRPGPVHVVVGATPRQPAAHAGDRFLHGCMQFGDIRVAPWPQHQAAVGE